MTSIGVETTSYFVENRGWLLGSHGTDPGSTPGITLDVSAFTAGTHYPNGYILSGTAVGIITAASSGSVIVVGPYNPAASDGTQTFFGLLFSTVKVPNLADTTKDVGGAALVHGFVRRSRLPLQSGTGSVDTAAVTAARLIHFA